MTIFIFIFLLGILVLVHECGHYILAKKSGIQIFEFGVGFPPRLWSFLRRGTIYSINLIPLGGFVRMKEYAKDEGNPNESFEEKNFFQRFSVVSAGILMNIIFAWGIFTFIFLIGFPLSLEDSLPPHARVRNERLVVNSVLPESPASRADIYRGDTILSLNTEFIIDPKIFIDRIRRNAGENPMTLKLQKGNEIREVSIIPEKLETLGEQGIGIGLDQVGEVSYGVPWALIRGGELTVSLLQEIIIGFGMLVGRIIEREPIGMEVAGPVGIALLTREVALLGLVPLMQFSAILSLHLAVINFLPLPALDGGRALFLVIERVRRKAMNPRIETLIHQIGFTLLLVLIVIITFRDLARIPVLAEFFS